MAAYILADVQITDPKQYDDYRRYSSDAFRIHDVVPIVRGGKTEVLEGREPGRIVILPFMSMEAAREFYDSPEYRRARDVREGAAIVNMIIVEGV